MPASNRTLLTSCAMLILVSVGCCFGSAAVGLTGCAISDYNQKIHATPTSTPYPAFLLPESNNSQSLPEGITQKMDEIQIQVIQLRGFKPKHPLTRELLSSDQLKQNVLTDFLDEYTAEEAQTDAVVLSTLGLLEPDFDLISFYHDLYSEQVAGYYDDTDKEMYVVQGSGFGGQESSVYAHEYLHVLQDQSFDLRNGLKYNPEDCELDTERCLGVQSLIEGDATVTEQKWLTDYAGSQDRKDIMEFYSQFKSPIYDSAPEFMKHDFMFPYQYGAEFVYSLLDKGGWQAVNSAYSQPPVSAEQILHPNLYPDHKPVPVKINDLSTILGKDWREIDSGVLGEWYTYLILAWGNLPEYRIPETEAHTAATGWGGDNYVVFQNQSDRSILFAEKLVFDSDKDAEEYWSTFQNYGSLRWSRPTSVSEDRVDWTGSADNATILRDGNTVYWVISPEAKLTNSIIPIITR